MNAEQMFKVLGYEQIKNDSVYIAYRQPSEDWVICFDIKNEFIRAFYTFYDDITISCPIMPNELKAINQQCKELGWLD